MSQGKGPGTRDRSKPRKTGADKKAAASAVRKVKAAAAPTSQQVTFTAEEDHRGDRLDRFLAGEIADYSRSQIQRLIENGHVTHSRFSLAKPNSDIREGDVIGVTLPAAVATAAQAEDLPIEILYDDIDIVVVNKPAGMVVHPAAGNPSGTLVNALLHHVKNLSGIGGEIRPGIVHRLDKGTSGVMVVAKNDDAHRELTRQFHDREVEKEYVALAWGLVQQRKRINARIGRDPNNRIKMSTRASRSRDAITRVTWSRDLEGVTLLRVAIHTGRTHQIRVHLAAVGHPVVGDATYGGVRHPITAPRPMLHAIELSLDHPVTGERLRVETSLPADFVAIRDALGVETSV